VRDEPVEEEILPPALPAAAPLSQAGFEYSELEAAVAEMDVTIRRTRTALDRFYISGAT
jgi:hypothetical protein